jgi:hypothetical protein
VRLVTFLTEHFQKAKKSEETRTEEKAKFLLVKRFFRPSQGFVVVGQSPTQGKVRKGFFRRKGKKNTKIFSYRNKTPSGKFRAF